MSSGFLTGLALNAALASPNVPAIYALGALDICAFALGAPAERASVIRVVGREHVASAMALKALSSSLARVAGPAAGTTWTYLVDASTFVIAAVVISRMQALRPQIVGGHPTVRLVLAAGQPVQRVGPRDHPPRTGGDRLHHDLGAWPWPRSAWSTRRSSPAASAAWPRDDAPDGAGASVTI